MLRKHNEYSREDALHQLTEYFCRFFDPEKARKYALQMLPYASLEFDDWEFDPDTGRVRIIGREDSK